MRRWLLPGLAGALWLIVIAIELAAGTERVRAGTDRLSVLLAIPRQLLEPARQAFMAAIGHLPSVGGQLIAGLTTGDVTRVSEALASNMKTSSLTHLTAVSGANCQVVVLAVFFLLARVGLSRAWRVIGSVAMLVGFVAFVTPQSSVARAAVMAVAVLAGVASGKLTAGTSMLAVSVVVLLIIEPRWAVDYGFALSVLATLGLLTLTQPLVASVERWKLGSFAVGRRLSPGVRMAFAVPMAATIACQPVLILLQPSLSTYGVLANILAEPVAAAATMSGLVVACVAVVFPSLASLLARVAWLPAEWIGRVAQVTAGLPMPRIGWLDGLVGTSLASLVCASIVLLLLKPKFLRPVARRSLSIAVAAVALLAVFITLSGAVWRAVRIPDNWSIVACDVGQGDAFAIRSTAANGEPHFALIDTGRNEERIRDCVTRLGIQRFDFIVLTHWDRDHVGGVDAVLGLTKHLLVIRPADPSEELILEHVSRPGIEVELAHTGTAGKFGHAAWQVLWPDAQTPSMQTGNPGSIAMLWNIDGITFATLADMGGEAQDTLAAHLIDLPHVDVLKVAHHGSADTSQAFTERLHPKIALIGVGANNGYGHPTRSALSALQRIGAQIERTDQNGMVVLTREHDRIVVYTDR